MSKNSFLEYLRTIMLTFIIMVIALTIILATVQHRIYTDQAREDVQDENFEYYLIGVLIDKNNYLASQYPKNYRINLKLGILYELNKDPQNSEEQFKLAIAKAPFGEYYPVHRLAGLYIRYDRLTEALQIMDKIPEKFDRALIEYKAEIYSKTADKYYAKGDYKNSILKYQKALFYYQIIKSDQIKTIKNSLASSYVYLAEKHIAKYDIEEAISAIEMANTYVDAPILKYKLAILLVKNQPELAYKYFEEVFKKEPSIINYDVYYNFLTEMASEAQYKGNIPQAELYRYKAKKFNEYFQNNILSVNDVSIDYINGQMSYSKWKKKYTMNLEVQLKNVSSKDLKSLFVHTVFSDDYGVIVDYSTKVADSRSVLKPGEISPVINIKTFYKLKGQYSPHKNITAEIAVSKLENSYKLSLTTIKLKEVKRIKRHKLNWKTDFKNWLNQIRSKKKPVADKNFSIAH